MKEEKTGANPFLEALERMEAEKEAWEYENRRIHVEEEREKILSTEFNITSQLLYPYEEPITLLDVYHMTPAEVMFTASRGTKILK
jgi:hypothetical protein